MRASLSAVDLAQPKVPVNLPQLPDKVPRGHDIPSICYTFDGIAECVFDFVVVWRAKSSYDEYCMDKQKYRAVLLMKADRLTNL